VGTNTGAQGPEKKNLPLLLPFSSSHFFLGFGLATLSAVFKALVESKGSSNVTSLDISQNELGDRGRRGEREEGGEGRRGEEKGRKEEKGEEQEKGG
jgi:hypothetical protein